MKKFEEFNASHEQAIKTIEAYLKPSKYEPSMHKLVQWMMSTDANPYAYLPQEWAGACDTAQGFAGLLHTISHALYDDGDICFVSVNGEPRIVFASAYDEDVHKRALTDQEKHMESDVRFKSTYEVKVLKITPEEFGPLYDAYQREDLKRCFISDASLQGVQWAADHYKKYNLWSEDWIQECEQQIESKRERRKKAGLG